MNFTSCKEVRGVQDNAQPLLSLQQVMGRFSYFINELRTTKAKVSLKSDVILAFKISWKLIGII